MISLQSMNLNKLLISLNEEGRWNRAEKSSTCQPCKFTIFTKRWNGIKLWSSAKENSQFLVSRALLDLTILKAMQVVLVRDPVQDITSFVAHCLQ
jgi:hypothetical protein